MMHCAKMSSLFIFLFLLITSCERKKAASAQGPWQRVLNDQLDSIVQAVEQDPAAMPHNLSDTKLFSSLEPLSTQAGLVPYGVNLAFWSDYAIKQRWIYLAAGNISPFEDDSWTFPTGTILVKHFQLPLIEGINDGTIPLETRVIIKGEERWYFYTYRWLDQSNEATLVGENGDFGGYTMSRPDGSQQTIDWYFPARDDCAMCHNEASGFILGVHTRQLNRNFSYGDMQGNQLEVWQSLQYFAADSVQQLPEALPRYPSSLQNEEFSLSDKARAYLDVNCGSCHRPEGSAPGEMDLTRIGDVSKLIGLEPDFGDADVMGAKIIVDGDPEKSLLWIRMNRIDEYHMPFVSSSQIDQLAVQLIGDWIRQGVSQQEL